MTAVTFIGDEGSAAGFRLAGAAVVVPESGHEAEALAGALARSELVILTSAVAAALPPVQLHRAQAALAPLLAIVPDLVGVVPLPDLAARLRSQLGLEA